MPSLSLLCEKSVTWVGGRINSHPQKNIHVSISCVFENATPVSLILIPVMKGYLRSHFKILNRLADLKGPNVAR